MNRAERAEQEKRVSFKRVQTGVFECYLDGNKTEYEIVNGSMGLSGRDTNNTYCISRGGRLVKVLGPLRTCKMFMIQLLTKRS